MKGGHGTIECLLRSNQPWPETQTDPVVASAVWTQEHPVPGAEWARIIHEIGKPHSSINKRASLQLFPHDKQLKTDRNNSAGR